MVKSIFILVALFIAGWFLPSQPIDPWKLFSLKKIINLIFVLAFIQALGSALISLLGRRIGAILAGFLGGLVSSTATTASLARKSSLSSKDETPSETLTFLSATFAMLIEAIAITTYGTKDLHWNFFIIFSGPFIVILLMIVYQTRRATEQKLILKDTRLEFLPVLKLSAFILGVLAVSNFLQTVLGQAGLLVLTFIVSLFEIHGSVIANLQLHTSGIISERFLGSLLAVSIVSSSISKLLLVLTLGSPSLKKSVMKSTVVLFLSLALSWVISVGC